MLIKSGGFPLLKLNIAKNEFLTGYMLNQLLYGARGEAQSTFVDHTSDIRKLSWRTIENVHGLVGRMDLSLPSMDDCIMEHTLFPYHAWCLTKSDAEKLYAQYAYSTDAQNFERTGGRPRGELRGTYQKTLLGLTWCQQCAHAQITGNNFRPFPIWHRLHFAPNILVCHVHQIPLSTLCDQCIDKTGMDRNNWIPVLECLCRKDLKDRADMSAKLRHVLSEITFKANDIAERKTPANFTPAAIKKAIKKRITARARGRTQITDILNAVNENIGAEAAELLEFNEHTVSRFIRGNGAPKGRNPIHVLAFGYAIFNGFDPLMETINGTTKWIPNRASFTSKKSYFRKTPVQRMPLKAEFTSIVASMTTPERDELQEKGRAWLLELLQTHPGLTRSEFWARHVRRAHEFHYLVWFDTDWYKTKIPTASDRQSKAILLTGYGAMPGITVEMIYERRALALKDYPLKIITKKSLMRPLHKSNICSIELRHPDIREALANCVDKGNAWQLRVAQTLSQMIFELEPNHHYADARWYSDCDSVNFPIRFWRAKQWLFRRKDQH